MSKKDYQALARAIHRAAIQESGEDYTAERLQAIDAVTRELADVLAANDPRFDRARFLEACETGTTRGMGKVGA